MAILGHGWFCRERRTAGRLSILSSTKLFEPLARKSFGSTRCEIVQVIDASTSLLSWYVPHSWMIPLAKMADFWRMKERRNQLHSRGHGASKRNSATCRISYMTIKGLDVTSHILSHTDVSVSFVGHVEPLFFVYLVVLPTLFCRCSTCLHLAF